MNPMITEKGPGKIQRIANRLLLSHIILAVVTATPVVWFAWEISCQTEDKVIKALLQFTADQGGDTASLTPLIRVFDRPEDLPNYPFPGVDLSPGYHELDLNQFFDREQHLLVWERPSDKKRLYIIADLPESRDEQSTISMLLVVVLMITLGGVAIGFMLTRKALQPLLRLNHIVTSSSGGELPPGFSEDFKNDEIGALARRMEKYVRQREKVVQGERQFLLDASHELRTPLTVLQGALDLLRDSSQLKDATSERRVERMERSVVRMQHTIECLLWLAHEENRTLSMSKEEFSQALKSLASEWRAVLPVEVSFRLQIEPGCVLDDPLHLWLIAIRNLIENAAHHTDSGKIEVTIGKDRIQVSDTGCGISEEMLSKITETWVRGPQTRGYGLGLSIVNRIAGRMGWSLRIVSKVNEGAVVTMERQQQVKD